METVEKLRRNLMEFWKKLVKFKQFLKDIEKVFRNVNSKQVSVKL